MKKKDGIWVKAAERYMQAHPYVRWSEAAAYADGWENAVKALHERTRRYLKRVYKYEA